jgi:N-dimethylarginine dimethylaminohydrolase
MFTSKTPKLHAKRVLKPKVVLILVTRGMYHITVSPDTFELTESQEDQNPYIQLNSRLSLSKAKQQHNRVVEELNHNVHFKIKSKESLPDLVFVASLGLSLPRLPEAVVILPNMKYESRKNEIKYAISIFDDLKIRSIPFPSTEPFEGQGEAQWFDGGKLLVVGYGFRSSKETVSVLRQLLTDLYNSYGVEPPKVLGVKLKSFDFYHLDMAMLPYTGTAAFVQKRAFSEATIARLRKEIGEVRVLETHDEFCLNSVIETDKIITPKLSDPNIKRLFEETIGLPVTECNISEFQKSGGGISCLVFTVYDPRMVKRKNNGKSPPSPTSPRH